MPNPRSQPAHPTTDATRPVIRRKGVPGMSALATSPLLTQGIAQRASSGEQQLMPTDVPALQRSIGNQAVQQLLGFRSSASQFTHHSTTVVQPKLQVGPAHDGYEQEADRVANNVMRTLNTPPPLPIEQMLGGPAQGAAQPPGSAAVQQISNLDKRQVNRQTQTDASQSGAAMSPGMGLGGGAIDAQMESTIQRQRGQGRPLEETTRHKMEAAFGTDFSGVKVHTNAHADQLNRSMNADAFTTGSDLFFRQGTYAPGSADGQKLIAHELTHVVQQSGGQHVQRKNSKPGVQINGKLPANRISTKSRMMHLDFVRMKRMDVDYKRIIGKKLGMNMAPNPNGQSTYGHYWTEIGDLQNGQFRGAESYGWWPQNDPNSVQALQGVNGVLNGGNQPANQDPHHGENADTEFHPVMKVDDGANYDAVRNQVTTDIRQFASSFRGSWNWRFGWGKNCQTFQTRLKTKLGLHYKKAKEWLRDPAVVQAEAQQAQHEQEHEENRTRAVQNVVGHFTVPNNMTVEAYLEDPDAQGGVRQFNPIGGGALRAGGLQLGATGRTAQGKAPLQMTTMVEYVFDDQVYWMSEPYWEMYFDQQYPANS